MKRIVAGDDLGVYRDSALGMALVITGCALLCRPPDPMRMSKILGVADVVFGTTWLLLKMRQLGGRIGR